MGLSAERGRWEGKRGGGRKGKTREIWLI